MAVSKTLRYQVLRRDNFTCRYCGRGAPEVKLVVDHVVAEALGGRGEPSNLVTACADCNGGKSATPADAAVVAGVEDDALRWAQAVSASADRMLADLRARQTDQAAFEERWNGWAFGRGGTVPLPPDWRFAVDRFTAAGLPLLALLESVDIAMSNQKVRHDGRFRYLCGIAWARIGQLHEEARVAIGPATLRTPADRHVEQLENAIQANLGEGEFEKLIARARESLTDAGFDTPSHGSMLVQCVELLMVDLDEMYDRIYMLGRHARKCVPEGKLDALLAATEEELKSNLGDGWTCEDYEVNLARNALTGLGELAKRAS